MNENRNTQDKRVMKRTLDKISKEREAPTYVFVALLILYLIASGIVSSSAGTQSSIKLFGASIPVYSFAGVFSALSQICVIFMTSFCGKKGYYTSLILLLVNLPMVLMGVIIQHNITSLPGIFGNLLAIIAITIIYIKSARSKTFQEAMRDQAVTDALTGMPNRFAVTTLLKELIKEDDRFVVASIDLNGFKSINDTMGFDAGNDVLAEVASRWMSIADAGVSGTLDFIARTSGDEFLLVIRDYHTEEDVLNTIKQYESVLGNRLTVNECDFYITASFGYAEFLTDTNDGDSLVCSGFLILIRVTFLVKERSLTVHLIAVLSCICIAHGSTALGSKLQELLRVLSDKLKECLLVQPESFTYPCELHLI